jgi:membrane protein YqaA with SNARE-associated domain
MSSNQDHTAKETKSGFLLRNLVIGFLWFALIISIYILAEDYVQINFHSHISAILENQLPFFGLFTLSEVLFGLIPPEMFMMISMLHNISLSGFMINIAIYAAISYAAGVIGYGFGRSFSKTLVFEKIKHKYLIGYEDKLTRFGLYLVFVGAVTPIPFSATCMLAGSIKLPVQRFLLIRITRMLRFGFYGWMVWNVPQWFQT